MTVTYRNSVADYLWFNLYTLPRLRSTHILLAFMTLMLGYTWFSSLRRLDASWLMKGFVFVFLLSVTIVAITVFTLLVYLVSSLAKLKRVAQTERTVTLSDVGVTEVSAQCRHETTWAGVQRVVRSRGVIMIYFTDRCAYLVPRRAFGAADAEEQFYRFAATRQVAAAA